MFFRDVSPLKPISPNASEGRLKGEEEEEEELLLAAVPAEA